MKLFVLIAVLLITGGSYLIVAGVIRMGNCIDAHTFALDIWSAEFWLLVPGKSALGLGPNARWFIRVVGGLLMAVVGSTVLRVANK